MSISTAYQTRYAQTLSGTQLSHTSMYVALLTGSPFSGGNYVPGSELNVSGYARVPVTFGSVYLGKTYNTDIVRFATATSAWGDITYIALCEATTGAWIMAQPIALTSVPIGETLGILPGQLSVYVT